MSEVDNLESLSNSEIRAKLVQYGLANVPVTDSSRNVLIKRLRVALTGGNSPAIGSAKKPSRRETIAVTERASPAKFATTENVSNRRTITAASVATQPTKEQQTPGKISNRRSKLFSREEDTKSQKQSENRNPILIEDSDEDSDDNLILAAAENVEKFNTKRRSSSRGPSLTKSTVVTTSVGTTLPVLVEEKTVSEKTVLPKLSKLAEEVKVAPQKNVYEGLKQQRENRIAGYSAMYSAKTTDVLPKYVGITATSTASPISASIYPRLASFQNYNEFSDDTEPENVTKDKYDEDDQLDTPFLSNFAKNLERLKAEPLSASKRYSRSRNIHEVSGRVSMHRSYAQRGQRSFFSRLSNGFQQNQWLRHIILIIVLLAIFYVFFLFWQ